MKLTCSAPLQRIIIGKVLNMMLSFQWSLSLSLSFSALHHTLWRTSATRCLVFDVVFMAIALPEENLGLGDPSLTGFGVVFFTVKRNFSSLHAKQYNTRRVSQVINVVAPSCIQAWKLNIRSATAKV